jgi:hypothetical protein
MLAPLKIFIDSSALRIDIKRNNCVIGSSPAGYGIEDSY